MRALVLAGLVLVGCAQGAAAPTPSGVARVCVLRPESLAGSTTMAVRDNGRLVGATRGGTYFCWLAAPGEHQITSIDDDTGPTLLHARPDAHYWLHQEVSALAGDLHAHLDFVDEEAAIEMLDRIDTRVLLSVPGHEDDDASMAVVPARR